MRLRLVGGLISALISGSSGPGSSDGRGCYVVFLEKTLYSRSDPFQLDVPLAFGECNAGGCLGLRYAYP